MTRSGWSVGCVGDTGRPGMQGGRAGSTSNAMLRSAFTPVDTVEDHMESV